MPNQFDSNRGINGNVPFHFLGTSGGLLVCGATLIFVNLQLIFFTWMPFVSFVSIALTNLLL